MMSKNYFSFVFSVLLFKSIFLFSQVGINTATPNSKSVLDIYSTTKGMLTPRLTSAARNAIAPGDTENGLLIYNTDTDCFNYWSKINNSWLGMCGTPITSATGLAAINCAGAVAAGTLTQNTAANGITLSVPYTSGNGGSYASQNIPSTGVTGLTAAVSAGNFASGNGNIVFTISGTPASSGTASFALNMGGTSCTFTVSVGGVVAQYSNTCTVATQGTYVVTTPLTSSHKILVTLNVTSPGKIRLISQDKNGIYFDSGEVTVSTGSQTITLNSSNSTSGAYPLTSEEISNGANGADNQSATYTLTNLFTNTVLSCSATINVIPKVTTVSGMNLGTTAWINGGIINGVSDGIIQLYFTSKYPLAYFNAMLRNLTSQTMSYSFVSTAYFDPNTYSYSGTLPANGSIGSIDPFLNTLNQTPSTSGSNGAHAGNAQGAEMTGVGINIQNNGKWYKYRLLYNSTISSTTTNIVLYGVYNIAPEIYKPVSYINNDRDPQSYWP